MLFLRHLQPCAKSLFAIFYSEGKLLLQSGRDSLVFFSVVTDTILVMVVFEIPGVHGWRLGRKRKSKRKPQVIKADVVLVSTLGDDLSSPFAVSPHDLER